MVIEPLALGVVRREVDGVTGEGARREELEEEAEAEEEGLARGGAVTVAEPDEDGGASFDGFLTRDDEARVAEECAGLERGVGDFEIGRAHV